MRDDFDARKCSVVTRGPRVGQVRYPTQHDHGWRDGVEHALMAAQDVIVAHDDDIAILWALLAVEDELGEVGEAYLDTRVQDALRAVLEVLS
jgi:hypothetical protein